MKKTPAVSIIVVNWNGLADTRECLESLSRITYPGARVIVVDNGSREDEAHALRAEFPAFEVVAAGANLGFTGGNNLGIGRALADGAEYVLCLNNDTVVDPGFLEPLVAALEEDPRRALASSHIFLHAEPERTWYFGASVSFRAEMLPQGAPAWHLYPEERGPFPDAPFETEVATGCVLLARADVLRELGGFDDRYFAYYEDVDLSLRAVKQGYVNVVVPASRVRHKVGRSTGGGMSPGLLFYSVRNAALLAEAHAPGGPRAGRAFYRAYARSAMLGALGWRSASTQETWRRVQAAFSAVRCARRGEYGRRPEPPTVTPLPMRAMRAALPVLHLFARAYWSLRARVPRPGVS